MKLIPNWKDVVLYSHSMWANYLGIGAILTPEMLYLMLQVDTDPRIWFALGVMFLLYGLLGRIKDQGIGSSDQGSTLHSPLWVGLAAVALVSMTSVSQLSGNSAADADRSEVHLIAGQDLDQLSGEDRQFLDLAVAIIGKWEGLRLKAYKDIVGVWTVCFGETKGVMPGDSYTQQQCEAMLKREVLDYRDRLRPALTPDTVARRLTVQRDVAYTSVAYNVGVHAFSRSTAVKRLNAGNIAGGCQALTWWNKAGGRVVRGLVNRRAEEYALCMRGVA